MKFGQPFHIETFRWLWRALVISATVMPACTLAASVDLATVPLATATNTKVLPNLMFILDNSGSMNDNFVPDWAATSLCKGNSPTTAGATSPCSSASMDRPPFNSADFNRIYYDPSLTYEAPWDASLATPAHKTSYSGTGSTPKDGYGIQSTATINLTTSYPDVEYCDVANPSDCLRNYNYLLPGVVNGKSYTTAQSTTASGSRTFVTGTVAAPTTTTLTAGPFYYVMIPGEYCSDYDQTTCVAATAPSTTYPYAAKVRWCKTPDLKTDNPSVNGCKLVADTTYKYARYPTVIMTAGSTGGQSSGKITVTSSLTRSQSISGRPRPTCFIPTIGTASCSVGTVADCNAQTGTNKSVITSIKLINASHPSPGTELLTTGFTYCDGTTSNASTLRTNLTSAIRTAIGNGFGATSSSDVLTITSADGTYDLATLNASLTSASLSITTNFGGGLAVDPVVVPGSFQRVNIVSGQTYGNIVVGGTTIVDRSNRLDCAARPNCSYAEELANFANWYAWYRTRMQMMKSTASLAFKDIDNQYRVGFITINGATSTANYLKINAFDSGVNKQKANWYKMLFSGNPGSTTPLRGALSRVGQIFAGKKPLGISDDPMEYSCQQNFALLTTDGYWNLSNESSSYTANTITGGAIGDMDSATTPREQYEGTTASSGSLADIAKYYYDTDLRDQAKWNNCTGALGLDVCPNNVFVSDTDKNQQQHMTTFTLGLGVDGLLSYQPDYQTATTGDYYLLKNGLSKMVNGSMTNVNWPWPDVTNTSMSVTARIDDLWHAAVNGHGVYFSAKSPSEVAAALKNTLTAIKSKVGSGAAAATSTLNPVAGDNYAYVASYSTVKWTGNLEERTIDTVTGEVSKTAVWCAEDVVAGTCSSPGVLKAEVVGGSKVNYCVTTLVAPATVCTSGIQVGMDCKVAMPVACTGTMASTVSTTSDSRTIWTADKAGAGTLVKFDYANLDPTFFATPVVSNLSQWGDLSSSQRSEADGANLVNYLRGHSKYENSPSNPSSDRIYRYREAVLGDAIESQPAFVGKPTFSYVDTGYDAFKSLQATRTKAVFMGTNDGMLHAFAADTGKELWAYVPSMVIPNMWKLADDNYATMHTNYVNGSPMIADIAVGGAWKTILVGGLNGGGRGYYALDITNPASPSLLWEFTPTTNPAGTTGFNRGTVTDDDLGYSYGNAVVTKRADDTWVVLITSGYNNTNPGSGGGFLYVLDAGSGKILSKIGTGSGSALTPSGLAKIAMWADDAERKNYGLAVYGGDLMGDLWRFDINAGTSLQFASFGATQPITARPELGLVNGKWRVVFVGTGKYLEIKDLTNHDQQTLYAIKDDNAMTTLLNPKTVLEPRTISSTGSTRTATGNVFSFSAGRGWYVDYPDNLGGATGGSERQNVDGQLVWGTLMMPTTVPESSECSPGGHSWFNFFDYATGLPVPGSDIVSTYIKSPIVGLNVIYPSGSKKPVVSVVTSDNPTPTIVEGVAFGATDSSGFQKKRVIWRELVPD